MGGGGGEGPGGMMIEVHNIYPCFVGNMRLNTYLGIYIYLVGLIGEKSCPTKGTKIRAKLSGKCPETS